MMDSPSSEKMDGAIDDKVLSTVEVKPALVDDTIAAAKEYSETQYMRLRLKTDLILIPMLWLTYGLMQADKASIGSQATFNFRQDTGLVGQQYALLSTLFYISFFIFEFPANWLMQRVHVGRTLGVFIVIWGVLVFCIAFGKNFAQLAVLRFLQGALECVIPPSFLLITGAFYTTREHTLRAVLWGTAGFSFSAFSDSVIYLIAKKAQDDGIVAPWKVISFFLGGFTIVVGFFAFFLLGTPREVLWLNAEEKRMTAARTINNLTGTDRQKHGEWDSAQAWECLRDPQVYFFFFVQLVNGLPNSGIQTFGNLVLLGLGFSPLDTIVKGSLPRNCFSFVLFISLSCLTLRYHRLRFWIMMICLIPSIIGLFLLAFLPNTPQYLWPKYTVYIISSTGGISGFLPQTFAPSNVAGRTKKTVVLTVIFIAYGVGNCIGPQVFQSTDAPRYVNGITICATMYAVAFALLGLWRIYYALENRRRSRAQKEAGISEEQRLAEGQINAEQGMTDRQNIHFRYAV